VLPDPGTSKFGARWMIALVACSVIAAVDGGYLMRWLALSPIKVVHGQVWRLLTWPLVDLSGLTLILTCIAIGKFGDALSGGWGERRLQRYAIQIAVGAGLVTVAAAALTGGWYMSRLGGWAMCNALVIGYARQYPRERVDLYGLKLAGGALIALVASISVGFAVYSGVVGRMPELAACALALLYPRGLFAQR